MNEFLSTGWDILIWIYAATYQAGYTGCLIAVLLGVFLSKKGVNLTGRPRALEGRTYPGGRIEIREREAIQAKAQNPVEHFFGVSLQIAGTVLVGTALVAAFNLMSR
ncbi:hypothetical protein [Stenotrophomonas maltophilia]|uniref:hypothetical protein n=1 Tax=Stenotrophomonas maltophilia TaxID=40324 RepID=UPI003BF80476